MRRVLADTGPLYALVDRSDRLHSRACREVEILEEQGISPMVATPVLAEGYNLVLRRLGANVARTWCRELVAGSALLNPSTDDYLAAATRLQRYDDQSISLTDGVVAELADRLQVPVWTFDHHFDLLETAVWRV